MAFDREMDDAFHGRRATDEMTSEEAFRHRCATRGIACLAGQDAWAWPDLLDEARREHSMSDEEAYVFVRDAWISVGHFGFMR